jgi:hypothetical protein
LQTALQISSASRPALSASLTVKEPSSLIAISCEKEVAQASPNESTSRSRRSEILKKYFLLRKVCDRQVALLAHEIVLR